MPLINKNVGLLPWISYTGDHKIYGTRRKGWIECYTDGTLTVPARFRSSCDLYLLSNGSNGTAYRYYSNGAQGDQFYWGELRGDGGQGGTAMEYFAQQLSGDYQVAIGKITTVGTTMTTANGTIAGGKGGTGRKWEKFGEIVGSSTITDQPATAGEDGRVPFTGHTPLTDGLAKYKLGAGGSGGAYNGQQAQYNPPYLHSNGQTVDPYPNTGAGGWGAEVNTQPAGNGATGIVIVRWGY